MRRMAIGWRSAMENLKPWTTKFMSLMIEWGRTCWTTRNGMLYGERRQQYTMEQRGLQAGAKVYLNAPKEEVHLLIKNSRSKRKNMRNMPNVDIVNWTAGRQSD